jgi:hypothetical protein
MADVTVTKPTLTYFNVAGRAELARLILEEAGIDYDFVTLTSWADVKSAYVAAGASVPHSTALVRELALLTT